MDTTRRNTQLPDKVVARIDFTKDGEVIVITEPTALSLDLKDMQKGHPESVAPANGRQARGRTYWRLEHLPTELIVTLIKNWVTARLQHRAAISEGLRARHAERRALLEFEQQRALEDLL